MLNIHLLSYAHRVDSLSLYSDMQNSDEPLQISIFLRLLEKEKAALVEEKEQLVRASQELLGQVDNQLPFDPNDPKVKELEEWECSVSRSVVIEVGFDSNLIYPSVKIQMWTISDLVSILCILGLRFWLT